MSDAVIVTSCFFGINGLACLSWYLYRRCKRSKPVLRVDEVESYVPLMEVSTSTEERLPLEEQQSARFIPKPEPMLSSSFMNALEPASSDSSDEGTPNSESSGSEYESS